MVNQLNSNQLTKLVIEDYTKNYLSNKEICEKYNINRTRVQRILIKNNIKLDKRRPKIKVNNLFFSEYNEISCYWAGFILADGYIRTKKRFSLIIKLKKDDVNHLEKFKKHINFFGEVKIKNNYCTIVISSSQIIRDLNDNFSIKNKKSLTCYIDEKIPSHYMKDYLRGYFDGDGCISYTSLYNLDFIGTYKTINFVRDYFTVKNKIKIRTKDSPIIKNKDKIFIVSYSGISCYKCLNIMYENSVIYLDRKFKLYNKIKEIYINKK